MPAVILLVEDDDTLRECVADMLRDEGYCVREAEEAAVAMRILREDPTITLLVTDVALPGGMDGVELTRAVRDVRGNVAVLVTTAYAGHEGVAREMEQLGLDCMEKPFRSEALLSAIEKLMQTGGSQARG